MNTKFTLHSSQSIQMELEMDIPPITRVPTTLFLPAPALQKIIPDARDGINLPATDKDSDSESDDPNKDDMRIHSLCSISNPSHQHSNQHSRVSNYNDLKARSTSFQESKDDNEQC
jgi:hypothetical protein